MQYVRFCAVRKKLQTTLIIRLSNQPTQYLCFGRRFTLVTVIEGSFTVTRELLGKLNRALLHFSFMVKKGID